MEIWVNIIGSVILLLIGAVVLSRKVSHTDSRGKEISAIADSLELTYRACDAWVESAAFLHLDAFRQGWDHITLHTCSDVRQINGRPHPIRMRPERVVDRLTETMIANAVDIDFESSEFSRRFHVECESRRFAFDLFNPRIMECLMEGPPCRLEIARGHMVISDGLSLWSAEQFREQFLRAIRILECWPPHLADSLERGRWLEA